MLKGLFRKSKNSAASIKADKIRKWSDLSRIRQGTGELSMTGDRNRIIYAGLFYASKSSKVNMKLLDTWKVPLTPPSQMAIEKSRDYIINNVKYLMSDAQMQTASFMMPELRNQLKQRFVFQKGKNDVFRISNPLLDSGILSTSSFLKGRSYPSNDFQAQAQLAYDALAHYINMGPVNYFFSLGILDDMVKGKSVVLEERYLHCCIGLEALYFDLYANLPMGVSISDVMILNKVVELINL